MSDRDLLEAAARAAGYTIDKIHQAWRDSLEEGSAGLWLTDGTRCWNPLTDDGDEARLEAALGLAVEWDEYWVCVGEAWELFANHGGDKQAARRRAGVRAAAALTQPEGGA